MGAGKASSGSQADLLHTIQELGGTEEDLTLIADGSSGSEIDARRPKGKAALVDKTLQKDLAGLIKELGIEGSSGKKSKKSKKTRETAPKGTKAKATTEKENVASSGKRQSREGDALPSEVTKSKDGTGAQIGPRNTSTKTKAGSQDAIKSQGISKRRDALNVNGKRVAPEKNAPDVPRADVAPAKLKGKNASKKDVYDGKGGIPAKDLSTRLPKAATPHVKPARDKPRRFIFEPRPDWHVTELPSLPAPSNKTTAPSRALITSVHEHAVQLLQTENELYSTTHASASSSHRFLSTIMSSGTMSDKISALTLLVQESPLHTMKAFENLVGLAKKRNRGQAINSLAALKDLLAQGEVLPPSRKLRAFSNQPQLCSALQGPQAQRWKPGQDLPGGLQPIHLVAWAFEDWLKVSYFEVIKLLEIWCSDEVEFSRTRTLVYISELLSLKPEQEANLLRLLVNKLGDPDRKIASKASYLLLQLQTAHPLMKSVIVSHIESELLFRPRQTAHAKYYAVITLNQTVLSDKDEAVAVKLLEIFFALFVALLKEPDASEPVAKTVAPGADQGKAGSQARKKQRRADAANSVGEDVKQKLISAVLTGVHRAFPYSNSDGAIIQKHLDTLFKITHSSNFNTSVQALQLLQQLSASQQTASDRFYRTLYESLLDPRLLTSSKQAMYLNVLFRSLKADVKIKRVRAFVKRLVQVLSLHQPAFACGSLYLIKELQDTVPSLHSLVDEPENYDDDEEEVFRDVADDDDDDEAGNGRPKAVVDPTGDDSRHRRSPRPRYDPRKRDPEHCHADYACLWELLPLTVHYHPSVTLFADRLLHTQAAKPPKPDLSLHTLVHFLDRFVYRNAKTNTAPRGVSLMQPLTGDTSAYGLLLSKRDTSRAQPPVNAEPFAHQKPEDVKVDEVFFHRYFSQLKRAGRAKPKRRKNDGEEDDEDEGERRPEKRRKKARASGDEGDESDDDDDDDDEVWKALVGSRPDVAGADDFDDEDDVDLDLDDLDSSDEGDDDDGDALFGSAADLVEDGSEREGGRLDEDEDEDEDEDAEAEAEPDADDTDADDAAAAAAAIHGRATASTEPSSRRGLSPPTKRSSKRRKLKHLPTFASADDYAHMLGGEDEDGDGM